MPSGPGKSVQEVPGASVGDGEAAASLAPAAPVYMPTGSRQSEQVKAPPPPPPDPEKIMKQAGAAIRSGNVSVKKLRGQLYGEMHQHKPNAAKIEQYARNIDAILNPPPKKSRGS